MDIQDIRAAQERIAGHVRRTPLHRSHTLSARLITNVYVKYELFQKTGSFKARGAFNKMIGMTDAERVAGVVAVSGGNHAQAVAYASKVLGVDAIIVMPDSTPENYLAATRGYGADIILESSIVGAFARAAALQAEGRTFLHPFDDDEIIAGQGTVGLEIVEDLPEVTDVVVSIGGGGLAGGVSQAIKSLRPQARVWGVETVGADAMSLALAAGHPVELPTITSIAKTLGAPSVSARTLRVAQQNLEEVVVVPDSEAVKELYFIAERLKVMTEPAASCTLAAAERLRANFSAASHVVLILCGGNTSISNICEYRQMLDSNHVR